MRLGLVLLVVLLPLAACGESSDDEAVPDDPSTTEASTTEAAVGGVIAEGGFEAGDPDQLRGSLSVTNDGPADVWLAAGHVGARPRLLPDRIHEGTVDVGWLVLRPGGDGVAGSSPRYVLRRLAPGATTTMEAAGSRPSATEVGGDGGDLTRYRLCVDVLAADQVPEADGDEQELDVADIGSPTRVCAPDA